MRAYIRLLGQPSLGFYYDVKLLSLTARELGILMYANVDVD
jgi:hypothetical protein